MWVVLTFRPLKKKILRCLETSEADHPVRQRHVPEERHPLYDMFRSTAITFVYTYQMLINAQKSVVGYTVSKNETHAAESLFRP